MSSSAISEEANKVRPATGRRLMVTVVALMIVALIVLVAGVVFMQKEIRTMKNTLEGLKTLEDVSESQHKSQTSVLSNSRITLRGQTKGKRVRLSRSQKDKCEKITIPFCQNMPYTMGQFPNLLNHQTQDEAKTATAISKLRQLIESGCSPNIGPLVCSVLAPPCNGTRRPVVPCKELCKRATKNCKAQLKNFGIRLDSSMRCRFLPKESTSKCFNGSWPKNTPATGCNKVSSDSCSVFVKRIPPWTAQFPNYFGHMTAREAQAGFDRFNVIRPLAGNECSSTLAHFLCQLYFPSCTSSKTHLPPCRELCQETRTKCKRVIKQVSNKRGFTWPSDLKCKNFPRQGTSPCYMAGPTTEVAVTRSPQLGKCQVIKIPMCKSIPYNMTELPNFFQHNTQEEAALEIHQFWPLVEINCSPELAFFLCSLYAPLCSTLDSPPPPCRGLCSRVKTGCLPIIEKYGFTWPETMACEKFPEELGDEVCLDRPKEITVATQPPALLTLTQPPLRTEATGEGKCDALTIPLCSNLHYNTTRLPNFFNHRTQEEAALEVHQYFPLVKIGCSPDLKPFLCSAYAPPCNGPHKPCRELCNRARSGCINLMRSFGFNWPKGMACDKFPVAGGDEACFNGPKVTAIATQPPSRTEAIVKGKCDALTIPLCSNLHYNTTRLPNFFNHRTQQEATLEVHQYFPLVKIGCSPDLKPFLCSAYAPPCNGPRKPCRELCNRARSGCINLMRKFGFNWPKSIACDKFPSSADGTKCFDTQPAIQSIFTPTIIDEN